MQGQAIVLTQYCESHAVTRKSNAVLCTHAVLCTSNTVNRTILARNISTLISSNAPASLYMPTSRTRIPQAVQNAESSALKSIHTKHQPSNRDTFCDRSQKSQATFSNRNFTSSFPLASSHRTAPILHRAGARNQRRGGSQPLQLHQGRSRQAGKSLGIFASCIRAAAVAT